MIKLYDFLPSGNCYKVRLLLHQLAIPFERVEVNIVHKESRTSDFLTKNPNGRVPVLEIEPGKFLAESNAILYYLSQGTAFFPNDPWEQAQVMQWLFFEQYSHEPYIATSRYWMSILGQADQYRDALQQKREPGYAALAVMEAHLKNRSFFVGKQYTIADIALFAYTHVAEEGGFNLSQFPALQIWIERVKLQPHYLPITH